MRREDRRRGEARLHLYDDLTYLLEVDEAGLEEVADDCKIEKKGHRARLFKRLEQLRATAAPPAGPLFD